MKCLRCGYCCIEYPVIIIDDLNRGLTEGNLIAKPEGVRCKHLVVRDRVYHCLAHDYKWYHQMPCAQFSQMEASPDTPCRIGVFMRENPEVRRKIIENSLK